MADLTALADALWDASETCEPIAQPSRGAYPDLSIDDAYAVQGHNIERRIARGETVVGHKIGLTSLAMQRQLGVDQPDFGVITDAMVIPHGGEVDGSRLLAPKLEAEFAFRIATDVPVSPSIDELKAAIGDVAVAIELIDSRIADWKIGLVDTIADNASSSGIVVGPWRRATDDILAELLDTEIELLKDGAMVVIGPGSAVLGDPVVSLHWLATAIGRYGQSFAPGDVVLAGAVAASVPLDPGVTWSAIAYGFEPVVVRSTSRHEL
jgi:2-keto-4-pentenoate hydratase